MKYLHEPTPGTLVLDHRLTPEVRAMLAAMVSRSPVGGMKQRYAEVVEAVAAELWPGSMPLPYMRDYGWVEAKTVTGDLGIVAQAQYVRGEAENRLCEYPLHPKVQGFFDQFVGQYGHSSVMELTGSPTVAVEGVSWFTAWLLFDSPLVAGQEFSTRAVRRTDWPMARESRIVEGIAWGDTVSEGTVTDPSLAGLHQEWLEVYEAEVAWWTEHLTDPANRASLGIADKEPFRPALDRARWALPGTFATGAAFASNVRERARTLRDAASVNRDPAGPTSVWSDIEFAYRAASPGIAQYGLKEAVIEGDRDLPGHLTSILQPVRGATHPSGVDVELRVCDWKGDGVVNPYTRTKERSYADPWFNRQVRTHVRIECSLAVARDWHRHRTLYPWHLGVVCLDGKLRLDRRYEPESVIGIARTPDLLRRSHARYRLFLAGGDVERAALALPMGTRVVVSGVGGLRDVLYTLELRANAHGANFEYKQQAEAALYLLETRARLSFVPAPDGVEDDPSVFDAVGYKK
jgi:hypothetical protein